MTSENLPPPEEVEDEVAALIKTLHETERRLEELTGGEVDTVSVGSGRPFLLRRAQEERRDSEVARQAAILDALPARVALLDPQGFILSVNDTWRRFSDGNGMPAPQCGVGLNYAEICDQVLGDRSQASQQVAAGVRAVLKGETASFSFEYPSHLSTEQRWYLMTVTPLAGDALRGVVIMHLNITERKLAAAAFEDVSNKAMRRERMLTTTLSSLTDFAYIYDRAGRFLFANQPLLNLWGRSLDEVVGKNFFELGYPPDLARRLQRQVQEVFDTKQSITDETPYTSASGVEGYYEYIFSPAFRADGTVEFVVGSTRDVTERKRSEEASRTSEREQRQLAERLEIETMRFVEAQAVANVGSWETDLATLAANWSDETHRIFETDPKTFAPTHSGFLERVHPEDRAAVEGAFLQSLTHPVPCAIEHRLLLPDAAIKFVEERWRTHFDSQGKATKVFGTCHDITERRKTEAALRESNEKFHQLADNISDAFWIRSPDLSEVQYVSPAFEKIWGRTVQSLKASPHEWNNFIFAEDRARVVAAFGALVSTGPSLDVEYRIVRPNGEIRWVRVRGSQIRNEADHLIRHIGIVTDITERRQVETALRTSEERFRSYFQLGLIGMAITAPDRGFLEVNYELCRILGYGREELCEKTWMELTHPEDRAIEGLKYECVIAGKMDGYSIEKRFLRKDGAVVHAMIAVKASRRGNGTIDHVVKLLQDITEQKQAELEISAANRALEQQQSELRVLIDMMPAIIAFKGTDNIFRRVNQRFAQSVGRSVADIEGKSSVEIFQRDAARYDADDLKVTTSGLAEIGLIKSRKDPQGNEVWHQIDKVPVYESSGKVIGLVLMAQDITDRKRVADDLRVSEKRFKALFEQAAVGVAQTDVRTGRFVQINQRFCEILGRSREELEQLTFAALTHPQDLAHSLDVARQIRVGPLREFTEEKRYLRKDGAEVWANVTVSAMWAAGDEPDYFIAVAQDVTGRKKLEEQFRQSQKMDAIGTLAGGIAHDFNNILAAINGYTELSKMQLTGNPEVRGYLGSVLQASGRATELVRQILTFSRQQKVERRPIQLQPIVTEAFKLLRASIPSTIEFEISLRDAPVVLADATQIHQVLMNLGTNAWHAMKDGPGRLQVKLERHVVDASHPSLQVRLNPGDYARLSVSDSGSGMDQETLKRIFEPFFTTKAIGEGTGLGLAVVHGIMATHDGAVTVYSEPGEGTVFHLYFPAFAGATAAAIDLGEVPRGQGERILFVDDEELLVKLGQQTLTALGYAVETTTQPVAALAMVRADPQRFALVLTDQTMPGMTGVDLARQLLQVRPSLPIILLTGYGLSLTSERVKAAGIRYLLLKPTTIHSIGSAVHAAISARPYNI